MTSLFGISARRAATILGLGFLNRNWGLRDRAMPTSYKLDLFNKGGLPEQPTDATAISITWVGVYNKANHE